MLESFRRPAARLRVPGEFLEESSCSSDSPPLTFSPLSSSPLLHLSSVSSSSVGDATRARSESLAVTTSRRHESKAAERLIHPGAARPHTQSLSNYTSSFAHFPFPTVVRDETVVTLLAHRRAALPGSRNSGFTLLWLHDGEVFPLKSHRRVYQIFIR